MNKADLQYFHAMFNHEFFDGQLEPVIIQTVDVPNNSEDIQASYQGNKRLKPCAMWFNPELINDADTDEERLFILTVLLHEMTHQEIFEYSMCGIYDIDDYYNETEGHGEIFQKHASENGLTHNGYGLSGHMEERITELMHAYYNLKDLEPIL